MPSTQVKIYSLTPYRHLFPKATVVDKTVKMGATVSDTVDFIPMIVQKTRWQVEKFVESELRGLSTYQACEKLWYFVKHHIRYKKDERGVEQVRSARRLIHDGVGDCDCFTTFIDTCLAVLKIPTINRITKYGESFFQHIYPIVPIGNGNYIIMDCVVDKFNYEQPYTEKKDYKMDLQYLDGIDDEQSMSNLSGNIDAQDLLGLDGQIGDLGRKGNKGNKSGGAKKFFKKQKNMSASAQNDADSGGGKKKKKFGQRLREGGRKVLHVANRANPATVLLRAGILASMKLNMFKVAENLKWAYLTPEQAQAKGADMSKFGKMKKILQKIEGIFFATGGKPENLRKAMLTGRGNRHHEVNGLGLTEASEMHFEGISEDTPMEGLLGAETYNSEFVEGLEGVEGLGSAVATGAAIASATTVMTTIAALIKSIGSIFPKKTKAAKDSDGGGDGGEGGGDGGGSDDSGGGNDSGGGGESNDNNSDSNNNQDTNTSTDDSGSANGSENSTDENSETPEDNTPATTDDSEENKSEDNTPATTDQPSDESVSGLSGAATSIKAFWDNNKKWIKPVGIGLTVVGAIWLGYKHFTKEKKETKPKKHKAQTALNGISKHKKRKKKGARKKSSGKKSHIALM